MQPDDVRQWLTELGATGTTLDFDLDPKTKRATVTAGLGTFDATRADQLRVSLYAFLDAYQANLAAMNRAGDAVKLCELYGTIGNSATLNQSDKPGLQQRLRGLDFVSPLIDSRYRPVKRAVENFRYEYAQYSMLKLMFEGDPKYGLLSTKLSNSQTGRKSQLDVIRHTLGGLKGFDDRAWEYYDCLRRQAESGTTSYVPLAKYYHCAGTPSNTDRVAGGIDDFRSILNEGLIKAQSPGGSGSFGAWVSTKPLKAYGHYVFALSVLAEAYNDIRFKKDTDGREPTVDKHEGKPKFDVGFFGNLVIDPQKSVGTSDPKLGYSTLAFLAVKDEDFDDFLLEFVSGYVKRYGPVLGFKHANGTVDYAVFKLSTAVKIAALHAEVEPPVIPAEWVAPSNRN
jgi:hypothetical protein